MSKEQALSIQVGLLKKLTYIALSIENKTMTLSKENDLHFMDEELGRLRVILGEDHYDYERMTDLMETIRMKITASKGQEYLY